MNQETNPKAESAAPASHDAPVSAAQLAEHGRRLAAAHRLAKGNALPGLRTLLAEQTGSFDLALGALTHASEAARHGGAELAPAAAAILEHAPLIDAHLRQARGQLLHDEGVLPALAPDSAARILVLAQAAVGQGGGRIERAALVGFLTAYQESTPLLLAELRLLPAALRVALLGSLRDVAVHCERAGRERLLAAEWAGRMIDTAQQRSGDLILLVADMARAVQPLGSSFVAELARRLHGQGAALGQALAWIEARLADVGSSIARMADEERGMLAADGAIAANCLASLRLVGATDWRALLEEISPVEALLRADSDASYARMDGLSRDGYRLAVERLARATRRLEAEVAQEALALAGVNRAPAEGGLDLRRRHIGYYLAGPGQEALEARLQPQPGLAARLHRRVRRTPLALRIGAMALFTLLFAAAIVVCARKEGAGLALQGLIGLLALLGGSQLARALLDMMAAWMRPSLAPQASMPRMEFGDGIPGEAQALVAVSARLKTLQQAEALCRDLEVRYLANRDPRLRFCLLAT